MIRKIFEILKTNGQTLCSAESITGGKFSSTLISRPGASEIFNGGFICYSPEFKYNVLEVSKEIDIISEEMAIELAKSSLKKTNSDFAISFTGNASPNGIENQEKGLSWMAITDGEESKTLKFYSEKQSRIEIIEDTVEKGIEFIFNFLTEKY